MRERVREGMRQRESEGERVREGVRERRKEKREGRSE